MASLYRDWLVHTETPLVPAELVLLLKGILGIFRKLRSGKVEKSQDGREGEGFGPAEGGR